MGRDGASGRCVDGFGVGLRGGDFTVGGGEFGVGEGLEAAEPLLQAGVAGRAEEAPGEGVGLVLASCEFEAVPVGRGGGGSGKLCFSPKVSRCPHRSQIASVRSGMLGLTIPRPGRTVANGGV